MFIDLALFSESEKKCTTCGSPVIDVRQRERGVYSLQCVSGHQWTVTGPRQPLDPPDKSHN